MPSVAPPENERFVAKGDVRRAQHRERGGRARRRCEPGAGDANLGHKGLDHAFGAGARAAYSSISWMPATLGLRQCWWSSATSAGASPRSRASRSRCVVAARAENRSGRSRPCRASGRGPRSRPAPPRCSRRVTARRGERHLAPPPPRGAREHALDGERRVPHRRVRDQIGKNAREDDEQNGPHQQRAVPTQRQSSTSAMRPTALAVSGSTDTPKTVTGSTAQCSTMAEQRRAGCRWRARGSRE